MATYKPTSCGGGPSNMTTRMVVDKMTTVPDPNKQTFPIIQNPTQFFTVPNCPSPTKTVESVTLSMKQPSIQLPELIHGGGGDHKERSEQTTTTSFPKVKRNLTMKKTVASNVKSYKKTDNFGRADAIPYQCQSFRSTTKVKEVPITKRNRDMFSAAARSKPGPIAKSKSVSFYTKPFLWQAQQSTEQVESTNLPTRFLEEEENLRKVRGQKRKHGVPSHRQWFNDLHVGGKSTNIVEKHDYRDEADKIRQIALPPNAQELYMGRGINLPEDHSTNRRMKEWQNKIKAECELPNSAPATTTVVKTTMQSTISRYTQPLPKVTRSHSMSHNTSDRHSSIASEQSSVRKTERRKSQVERQKRNSEISRRSSQVEMVHQREQKKAETKVVESEPLKSEAVTLSEDNEMEMEMKDDAIDNSTPVEVAMEETKDEGEIATTTNVRPNSEMEIEIVDDDPRRLGLHQSSSFCKITTPNPLTSIDITLHISAHQKEELATKFTKLDSNRDGHITFQELTSVLPDSLTKSQRKFIKEVYEAVSSSTFFGLEEFVGVTCLGEMMTKLPEPIKDSYDDVDFASIQHTIMKYVMMFSTVDRQQTGAISVDSLLEVLSMATDRDLKSDQSQTEQILATIAKNASSTIDKVEYLAYLPFFLQCR
ncbi:uncharacterized protein [Asterias amurensis]|uniref:uncharacterized protein isoform X2 n=1 Tax=Asterias amurensis TaxID=7602 RepID=UPI003AB8705C